jgi:hypothetical protein
LLHSPISCHPVKRDRSMPTCLVREAADPLQLFNFRLNQDHSSRATGRPAPNRVST